MISAQSIFCKDLSSPTAGFISHQACDQCNRRKIKCGRNLPTCEQCSHRFDCCTYNRESKRKLKQNHETSLEVKISTLRCQGDMVEYTPVKKLEATFKPKVTFGPVSDRKAKKPQQNIFRVFKSLPEFSNPLCNRSGTTLFITAVTGNTWLNCILSVSGISIESYFRLKKDLKIPNELLLLSGINNTQVKNSQTLEEKIIIEQAFNTYFNCINPYMPLFSKESFFKFPRSVMLKSAVLASGLRLLPPSTKVKELLEKHVEIIKANSSPIYMKNSLDYLQGLLVLQLGLRGMDFATRISWIVHGLIVDIAHNLGLHLTNKKFPEHIRSERYFTYVAVINTDALTSVFLNLHGYLFMNHTSIKPKRKLPFDNNFNLFALHIIAELKLCQSCEIQKIKWISQRILTNNIKPKQLLASTSNVLLSLENTFSNCLNKIQSFPFHNSTTKALAERILIFMKDDHLSYKMKTISLVFSNLKENTPQKIIVTSLKITSFLILLNQKAGLDNMNLDRLHTIINVTIFLIRNFHIFVYFFKEQCFKEWFDLQIKTCLNLLDNLSQLELVAPRIALFTSAIKLTAALLKVNI